MGFKMSFARLLGQRRGREVWTSASLMTRKGSLVSPVLVGDVAGRWLPHQSEGSRTALMSQLEQAQTSQQKGTVLILLIQSSL